METKANYVAVGAFVLISMLAAVVFALWVAGVQYAEEFTVYRANFTGPVTGLGPGTIVRYNGIEVGNVRDVNFDPNDPRVVAVDLQIDPQLRLRQDSFATLELQGLTGGINVEITGGTAEAPFLVREEGQQFPVIPTRPSAIQQVFESTPLLIARLTELTDSGIDLLNEENRAAFADLLANLRDISATVDRNEAEFDATFAGLRTAVDRLNVVLVSADDAAKRLSTLGTSADETARSVTRLANDVDDIVVHGAAAQLEQLVGEARGLVVSLTRLSETLERQPTQILFGDRRQGYAPQ